ncbi:MAG: hypothetical protein LQ337_001804 [Flavoplaca oasis]|nr:MAG: hypothetical protein LQ337_001804 [Flavoplaca oasis]
MSIVIPFTAIQAKFGAIDQVSVVTMQAVSGAGYLGMSSIDIVHNVVPLISGEEEQIEVESQKIWGPLNADATNFEDLSTLKISAACNRIPVLDGHTACVSVGFKDRGRVPDAQEVKEAMKVYTSEATNLGCPSAASNAISIFSEDD